MTMYEKFCNMDIDARWIGLEKREDQGGYFCTPLHASVIGWENCIHYCFIKRYGDMVFAVNPENIEEKNVYPLAGSFKDFLRLILACGSTTAVEQIIHWDKKRFEKFLNSNQNTVRPEQREVLDKIQKQLKLSPIEDPYEYVKMIQKYHDDSKIEYSNEYYDALGIERPDGTTKPPMSFGTVYLRIK